MKYLLLTTALLLTACKDFDTPPAQKAYNVAVTPAPKTAMVAAANPLATEAGLKILRDGGSAIDAAIAVQATLGLVEPQSSGLGGGAFLVIYDPKTAKVWAYDGREEAPTGATADMFLDAETGKPRNYFQRTGTGQSTGTPSAIVMLHKAHEDYGRMDWGTQLDGSIQLAEDGFRVSPRMASMVSRMSRFILKNDPEAKAYFFTEDGEPIPEGFLRDNQPYAETLRAIASNPRALLEGEIAEDIVAKIGAEPFPGSMTLADMAKYQPRKEEALCTTYRKHTICGAQPPASGGVAVQSILGTLENFDMSAAGNSLEGWHLFSEASFLAYADRDKYVADPNFVDVPVSEMLDKNYLKSRAALISTDNVITDVKAGDPAGFAHGEDATPDNPGTSHFTIVDKDGLTVSMTTTIEGPFGSQRMVRGFLLNNQGEFLFTTGSPGGNSIIAYTAKTIVGVIDWKLSPQEAIELPNVIARRGQLRMEAQNLRNADTDELDRGRGAKEFGMSEEIVSGLENLGHKVRRSGGETSGLHIIYRQADGTLIGGADPRREGTAEIP